MGSEGEGRGSQEVCSRSSEGPPVVKLCWGQEAKEATRGGPSVWEPTGEVEWVEDLSVHSNLYRSIKAKRTEAFVILQPPACGLMESLFHLFKHSA